MKLSAIALALMLASASASASANITTFGTKNNTYTPPAPTTNNVPEELRKRFDTCPTIYNPLPIRIMTGNTGSYVRMNLLVGRFGDTINDPLPYGKVVQDTSKSYREYAHKNARLFDPKFNYMSQTEEFKPYLVGGGYASTIEYGESMYWRRLHIGEHNNILPVYVTPTYELKAAKFDKNILLPTRDIDIFEVLIFNQAWNIHTKPSIQKITDVLQSSRHPYIEARITFYRNKGDSFTWNYSIDNPAGVTFGPIYGNNMSGSGSFDIRKVRSIQFRVNEMTSLAGGGTKVDTIINEYGQRAWNFTETGRTFDPSVSDALAAAENRVYTENNCFYQ